MTQGELSITDLFCGAGGSSQGAKSVPGVVLHAAANHWQKAVDTHQKHHPEARHECADISQVDPRRFARTDILWASPECTTHSKARGRPVDAFQPDLFGDNLPDEATQRSRVTMWDVVRFSEVHLYDAVIVENVVEISRWLPYRSWLQAMDSLGYNHTEVFLNSMHAQRLGTPAPQSRDRQYILFSKKGNKAPDLDKWQRPIAFCPSCGELVESIQSWKNPSKQWGRYRQQYVYRCPKTSCRNGIVEPAWLPASTAIDWTMKGQRIGDREKPLADKTLARIQAGIERYWTPIHLEAAGHTYDAADPKHPRHGLAGGYMRAWPISDPLRTIHTVESKAIAIPPIVIPVEGRDGKTAQSADRPMRTQTARAETAIGFPPFIAELRGGGSNARDTEHPLATVTAGGNHHALVMTYQGNGTVHDAEDTLTTVTAVDRHGLLVPAGGTWNEKPSPTTDPHRTITTRDSYGLVMRNNNMRGSGAAMSTPVREPFRTMTTAGHQSVLTPASDPPSVDVNDVYFRMLEPTEVSRAMAFPEGYDMLGNRREQVRMAGNAVTPPAARDLIAAISESLNGEELEPFGWELDAAPGPAHLQA